MKNVKSFQLNIYDVYKENIYEVLWVATSTISARFCSSITLLLSVDDDDGGVIYIINHENEYC